MSNQIVRKKFDKDLHDKTDKLAKNKLIKLLKNSKYKVIENEDIHGIDLLLYDKNDKHIINCEVEIKTNWKSEEFQYDTVNFLRRKEKYCKLSLPSIFVIFSEDLTNYLVIKDKDVLKAPLEEVKNKYNYSGEYFRKIPLSKVIFNDIELVIDSIVK